MMDMAVADRHIPRDPLRTPPSGRYVNAPGDQTAARKIYGLDMGYLAPGNSNGFRVAVNHNAGDNSGEELAAGIGAVRSAGYLNVFHRHIMASPADHQHAIYPVIPVQHDIADLHLVARRPHQFPAEPAAGSP
ncbi:hypothetical protein D1872_268970 [compost metagenome]